MDLNLRLLRYLVAVVDEGHFGQAADRLYISAPALTKQIRRLERDLGLTLLNRDRHPITPTPEGAAFLVEARQVLAAAGRAVAVAQSQGRRGRNHLALGFVVTPLGRRTRELLDAFAERTGPDVLRLVELGLGEQTGAVLDGRVDASLAWGPVTDERLCLEVALTAPRVLAVPAGDPLAGRAEVPLAELPDLPHVRLAPDLVPEHWVRWWAADPRPDGRAVRYGPPVRTIAEFLERATTGREVAITSALLAEAYLPRDLVFVPIPDAAPSQVVLCTRPADDAPLPGLLRDLVRGLGR